MDFIERWFGIAPDGGDGTLEAVCVGAAFVAVVLIVFRKRLMTYIQHWFPRD